MHSGLPIVISQSFNLKQLHFWLPLRTYRKDAIWLLDLPYKTLVHSGWEECNLSPAVVKDDQVLFEIGAVRVARSSSRLLFELEDTNESRHKARTRSLC